MRTILLQFSRALVGAAFLAGPLSAAGALAGGLYQEHIYADSFGNLIVYSPAGYKRIVVGQGYLADALKTAQAEAAQPHQHDHLRHHERDHDYSGHCNRQPVLLHGRSYMYGLPDNVVPVPAGICHH